MKATHAEVTFNFETGTVYFNKAAISLIYVHHSLDTFSVDNAPNGKLNVHIPFKNLSVNRSGGASTSAKPMLRGVKEYFKIEGRYKMRAEVSFTSGPPVVLLDLKSAVVTDKSMPRRYFGGIKKQK